MKHIFYDNFIHYCREKGESASYACSQIGMSNATASQWKKRGTTPKKDLDKIANYFGISVETLLTKPFIVGDTYQNDSYESTMEKLAELKKQISETREQLGVYETSSGEPIFISYTGNGGTSKTSRYKDLLLKIVDALDEKGCKMLIEAYAEGSSEE